VVPSSFDEIVGVETQARQRANSLIDATS